MDVVIENNPLLNRIWGEWRKKDEEFSGMTEDERLDYCSRFQWLYPKETKRMVTLEALYSSVHWRRNREEFKRWFYVVGGHILSRVHLGDCSYFQFKKQFKRQFKREKCTSDDFSQKVLLALGMLGYITDFGSWYAYNEGSEHNHGYYYVIDREKLMKWDAPATEYGFTSTASNDAIPDWVMNQTSTISFQEKGDNPERVSWTKHPDWLAERQYNSICSVEVVKEGLANSSKWLLSFDEYQYFYSLSNEDQDKLMSEWYSYQKLRDLSCGIVGGCKDDSDKTDGKGYAGRFHSPMTNMKSEHRHRYLRIDGELVTEVDISSAQPSFLGIMLYQETGVESEWLRRCLAGNFYEWIKENTGSDEDRGTIKKWMMQYMYSCYQPNKKGDYDGPHHPTYENRKTKNSFLCFQQRLNMFLKKNEPAIYKKISYYKCHPEFREDKVQYKFYLDDKGEKKKKKKVAKGKWCSMLSYDLVKMEVEYIKNCIHALPADEKFWTIHDCICVKESRSLEVKAIMERVSQEMYGDDIVLLLKRENTSEERDQNRS